MRNHFNKQLTALLSDSSLYQALEMGNFEELKELQVNGVTKAKQRYFVDRIKSILSKKNDSEETKDEVDHFIAKCSESLKDLVVGVNDFTMGTDIAFGASCIVYRGYFKFLEVAIKKVALNTMFSKQLVG